LLAVCWLIGGWRKRRRRQSGPRGRSSPVSANVSRSQAGAGQGPAKTSSPAGPAAPTGDAQWVAPGHRVTIGGIKIERGLFYFGRSLPTYAGSGTENALVNPALPIGRHPGNVSGRGVPYYPSYTTLDSDSRRTYLTWLASGRDNPQTYIGYIFLYFYGLERRLFLDHAAGDGGTIVAEVRRLLGSTAATDPFKCTDRPCSTRRRRWPMTGPWLRR
jgi:hypothetical protein